MDDIIDEFFNDYEDEQNNPKLKQFLEFISELNYEGTDLNLDSLKITRVKPLRASKYIPRNGSELF